MVPNAFTNCCLDLFYETDLFLLLLFFSKIYFSYSNYCKNSLDELAIIQKLDGIIADLVADGLHDIADLIEIEKQKIGNKFNQAELQSQIELEDLIKTNKELLDE